MKFDRLLIYAGVFAIMGLSNAVIPILPELANLQKVEPGGFASSLLFSAYFLGALVTMLPFGVLADRFGNFRFIGFSVVLTAVSGLAILLSENLWVLLVSRFIEGSACGAFFPAAFATLSKLEDSRRYIGEFNFLSNAGLAAGALLSGLLADSFLKGAILSFTCLAFVLTLLLVFRSRGLIIPQHLGKSETLSSDFYGNLFKKTYPEITALFSHSSSGIWLSSFLLNGAIGVLIAYYPDYSLGVLTKLQLGGSIASLYVCAMIASLVAGHFNVNEKTIIRTGVAFSILGAIFAIKYPFLGFSSLGGGSGLATVGYALAAARINADRGLVMGLFNTTIYAGLSIVPIFAGICTGILSFESLFIANGFVLAGALILKD